MNNKYQILIIEDEINISNFVKAKLSADGYRVLTAFSKKEGMMMYLSHYPDLIILDLGLPDADGMDFIREIRRQSIVPILVLSARSGEKDKVHALDLGSNDYMTKPFGTEELAARIRSIFRNRNQLLADNKPADNQYRVKNLRIDYDERKIYVDEKEVRFTRTEYNIVSFLSRNSGKTITYEEIINYIWNWYDEGSVKKLQVNMANIRRKLGEKPGNISYIFNELGVGYRMST